MMFLNWSNKKGHFGNTAKLYGYLAVLQLSDGQIGSNAVINHNILVPKCPVTKIRGHK